MTSPQTRTPTKEERREALLNAGFELFRTRGLAATTVDEIARTAGVAKGTFYLYFSTRDELLEALRVEFANGLRDLFEGARPPAEASRWEAFLGQLVEAAVAQFADQREMHDLLMALPHAHGGGPLARAMDEAHDALVSVLRAGADAGALEVSDAAMSAWLLLDLIQSAGDRASADPANTGRYTRACVVAAQRWLASPGR